MHDTVAAPFELAGTGSLTLTTGPLGLSGFKDCFVSLLTVGTEAMGTLLQAVVSLGVVPLPLVTEVRLVSFCDCCCLALLALSRDLVDLLVVGPGECDWEFLSICEVVSDKTLALLVLCGDEEVAFFSAV